MLGGPEWGATEASLHSCHPLYLARSPALAWGVGEQAGRREGRAACPASPAACWALWGRRLATSGPGPRPPGKLGQLGWAVLHLFFETMESC